MAVVTLNNLKASLAIFSPTLSGLSTIKTSIGFIVFQFMNTSRFPNMSLQTNLE